MNRRMQSILGLGGAGLLALATAACSGSSGTPTSPEMTIPVSIQSASVAGSVVSVPKGASKAGIRVSLDSPRVETVTDAQGAFRFDTVDSGVRTLHFQSSKISAALAISGLMPGSTRTLSVALTESAATEADDDDQGDDDQGDDSVGDDDTCPSGGNGDGCDDGNDDGGDDNGGNDNGDDNGGDDDDSGDDSGVD